MGSDASDGCLSVDLKDGAGSVLLRVQKSIRFNGQDGLSNLLQSLRELQNDTNTVLTQLINTRTETTKDRKNNGSTKPDADNLDEGDSDASDSSSLKRPNSNPDSENKRHCTSTSE